MYDTTEEEHDEQLIKVLQHIQNLGMILNAKMHNFTKTSVKFLGYVVDGTSINQTPERWLLFSRCQHQGIWEMYKGFLGWWTNSVGSPLTLLKWVNWSESSWWKKMYGWKENPRRQHLQRSRQHWQLALVSFCLRHILLCRASLLGLRVCGNRGRRLGSSSQ